MKPCPFCGDPHPTTQLERGGRDGPGGAYVYCLACHARGPRVSGFEFLQRSDALGGRTINPDHERLKRTAAIERWDYRPEPPDTEIVT